MVKENLPSLHVKSLERSLTLVLSQTHRHMYTQFTLHTHTLSHNLLMLEGDSEPEGCFYFAAWLFPPLSWKNPKPFSSEKEEKWLPGTTLT